MCSSDLGVHQEVRGQRVVQLLRAVARDHAPGESWPVDRGLEALDLDLVVGRHALHGADRSGVRAYPSPPMTATRPRILTGDTPTGQLHLGHWVGSVKRRVELQDTHDCYFILANYHAFTTRADKPQDIRRDTVAIVRDYLAMGIDPERSTIFLQSEIPAIHELAFLFAMLLPFNRVMRNPTLKTEIEKIGRAHV